MADKLKSDKKAPEIKSISFPSKKKKKILSYN